MIDLTLIEQYGWPMFMLVAVAIALVKQYIVMGWTYKEKCEEVDEWQQRHDTDVLAWQQRHDAWKDQAQALQITAKEALALVVSVRSESK